LAVVVAETNVDADRDHRQMKKNLARAHIDKRQKVSKTYPGIS